MSDTNSQNAAMAGLLYQANAKSTGVTYLLWFFLGSLGAHRFYAGKTAGGIVQLVLFVLGWATIWIFGFGLLFLIPLGIWVLVDAFLIPGWLRQFNTNLVHRVLA
jgi:TM2 domain-containing membrane protein YozV